jgi:hypothetical protein
MGLFEEYDYEIKEIDSEMMDHINQRLKEGDELLATATKDSLSGTHFAWVDSFSSVIDILDPLGEDHSGSLASRWYSAHWYNHNSAKNPYEDSIVFGQCLAVAKSLLVGKAKVVKRKVEASGSSRCIFHSRDLPVQKNLVFVLMPFTESWSDYIWKEEIKPTVEGIKGFPLICKRADDLFGQDVVKDIYESILAAQVIIAEITGRNANVFYELGMAHTLGKDVILLTQGSQHIPFDLYRFRHCIYSNDGPGYKKLREYLPDSIRGIIEKNG